jgi:hypothetical protein
MELMKNRSAALDWFLTGPQSFGVLIDYFQTIIKWHSKKVQFLLLSHIEPIVRV